LLHLQATKERQKYRQNVKTNTEGKKQKNRDRGKSETGKETNSKYRNTDDRIKKTEQLDREGKITNVIEIGEGRERKRKEAREK